MPAQRWLDRVAATRETVLRLFPAGQGLGAMFGIGPRGDLQGRALSELKLLPRAGVRAALTDPARWRSVHLNTALLPLHVTGRISGKHPGGRQLAVAVNGRIAATSWSF